MNSKRHQHEETTVKQINNYNVKGTATRNENKLKRTSVKREKKKREREKWKNDNNLKNQ